MKFYGTDSAPCERVWRLDCGCEMCQLKGVAYANAGAMYPHDLPTESLIGGISGGVDSETPYAQGRFNQQRDRIKGNLASLA